MNQIQTTAATATATATGGNAHEPGTQKQQKQHGKKENRIMKKTFVSLTSMVGIGILMLTSFSSYGATWNWNGDGTGDNWSTGDNWVENTAPASQNDTIVNLGVNSAASTPNVDSAWTIQQLNFAGTNSSSTVLSGETITIEPNVHNATAINHTGGGGVPGGHAGTINNNLHLVNTTETSKSYTIFASMSTNPWDNTLTINGNLTADPNTLTSFQGNGIVRINGQVTANTLHKANDGYLLLYNTSNSINKIVHGGGLLLSYANNALGANVWIQSGPELRYFGLNGFSQTVGSFAGGVGGDWVGGNVIYTGTQAAGDEMFSGRIRGGANFEKQGSNTLTMTTAAAFDTTGTTTVTAGTLLINGDHSGATGWISVAAGARFGGDGILGSDVIFTEGAALVFDPTMTLTLNAGKTLSFSATYTPLDLVQADGSAIDWDALDLTTFTLVDGAGTIDFTNISTDTFAVGTGRGAYFQDQEGSLQLVMTIPEPSTAMLLIIGAALALRRRSRRE